MEQNNDFNTFWKLINTHRVEIPIIQRDYAQGRTDAKATQIREGFVKSLVDSLKYEKTALHLDFVYGKVGGKTDIIKIENNKKAIASLLKSVQSYSDNLDISFTYQIKEQINFNEETKHTFFIPLDGQQRLTTLYLLHWYLATRLNSPDKSVLYNFTYKTRRSSKDFCKALISNSLKVESNPLSGQIIDVPWFFSNWKKDPTVRSILNVIDEIHLNLKNESENELLNFWTRLTKENIITFEFLDLDKFELTDELYVKMNARGKHLTDFENFKAWLQEYTKEKKTEIAIPDWHTKLDLKWTDIFWNFKDSRSYEIDKEYLTFFNIMSLYFITENVTIENNKIDDNTKDIIDKFRNAEFISQSIYEKYECFKKENIDKIFQVLHSLEDEGFKSFENKVKTLYNTNETTIFKKLFGNENNTLNLPDRTFIYAIVKFLILKDKKVNDYNDLDDLQLFKWVRICKNLIYNVYIFNPETFINAIKSINSLSNNYLNIYEYIITNGSDISFFTNYQKNDEIIKAKLIINDNDCLGWNEHIINIEKHNYFNGQIDFILEISKIDDDKYDIELFKNYGSKSAAIFESSLLNKDFIFHRAFLTKKNYFLSVGENSNFCLNNNALRDKEENWRRVLRNPEKLAIFKTLLDEIETGKEEAGLNSVIKKYDSDSWKKYFVKSPEPFKCCDSYLIRKYDEENILLFKTSRVYGQHAELRTYSFYCNHIKGKEVNFNPFKNVNYWYNPRNENHPCIYFYDFEYKKKLYKMDIFYIAEDKIFELDFYSQTNKKIDISLQEYFEKMDFEYINDHLYSYTKSDNENELLKKIINLNNSLLRL